MNGTAQPFRKDRSRSAIAALWPMRNAVPTARKMLRSIVKQERKARV